jgi:hypothetical protein
VLILTKAPRGMARAEGSSGGARTQPHFVRGLESSAPNQYRNI